MPVAALIAVLSLTAATAADGLNDDERRYLTALIEARDLRADGIRQKIASLEEQAAEIKQPKKRPAKGRFGTSPRPGTKAYRDKQAEIASKIDDSRSELERVETGADVPDIRFARPPRQGSIGRLVTGGPERVAQVLGPTDMLVRFQDRRWWFQGFSTKNYVDDQLLQFDQMAIVDGTKTYTTVAGATSTVLLVRALNIDPDKVLAEFRAQSKPKAAVVKPAIEEKPVVEPRPIKPADPEGDARKRFGALLANSRNLIKAGVRETAEKNLKRIIAEVPGTAIAAEAQKELDGLK
jgi:hypothetical protein